MEYVRTAAVKFGVLCEIWKLILVREGDQFLISISRISNINFDTIKDNAHL